MWRPRFLLYIQEPVVYCFVFQIIKMEYTISYQPWQIGKLYISKSHWVPIKLWYSSSENVNIIASLVHSCCEYSIRHYLKQFIINSLLITLFNILLNELCHEGLNTNNWLMACQTLLAKTILTSQNFIKVFITLSGVVLAWITGSVHTNFFGLHFILILIIYILLL